MKRPQQTQDEPRMVIINDTYQEQGICIRSILPKKLKEKLTSLLRENTDVIAWQPNGMVKVPRQVIEHKLNDKLGVRPVRQKKRDQYKEWNKAINDEVDKLVSVGIVRESLFLSWVAYPVLVKKDDR